MKYISETDDGLITVQLESGEFQVYDRKTTPPEVLTTITGIPLIAGVRTCAPRKRRAPPLQQHPPTFYRRTFYPPPMGSFSSPSFPQNMPLPLPSSSFPQPNAFASTRSCCSLRPIKTRKKKTLSRWWIYFTVQFSLPTSTLQFSQCIHKYFSMFVLLPIKNRNKNKWCRWWIYCTFSI